MWLNRRITHTRSAHLCLQPSAPNQLDQPHSPLSLSLSRKPFIDLSLDLFCPLSLLGGLGMQLLDSRPCLLLALGVLRVLRIGG